MGRVNVIVRTLNEADNIERFCRGYAWADTILIADGGSIDATVQLAQRFKNVQIKYFAPRIYVSSDGTPTTDFMNPESAHQNFLIDWATAEGCNWVVADDCDSVPNKILKENAIELLNTCSANEVCTYQLYMWMTHSYFPQMNNNFAPHWQSLWAWNPRRTVVRCNESVPTHIQWEYEQRSSVVELEKPYVRLHQGWPTPEAIEKKLARYQAWGRPQVHPLNSCGPVEPLPDWAEED